MWDELREEVELELSMLSHHLCETASLRNDAINSEPSPINVLALAAMLHGFYNGIENIFKRISIHCDHASPGGQGWHAQLLSNMQTPNTHRGPVISQSLGNTLKKYLDFRHVFRHSYTFQLDWKRLAPLVRSCDGTFEQVEHEVGSFLSTRPHGDRDAQ